jgi:hypothetical protein
MPTIGLLLVSRRNWSMSALIEGLLGLRQQGFPLLHVKHIADQGAAASDLTGVLVTAAGVVFIGLGHRDPVAEPRGGRGQSASALDLPRLRRVTAFFDDALTRR